MAINLSRKKENQGAASVMKSLSLCVSEPKSGFKKLSRGLLAQVKKETGSELGFAGYVEAVPSSPAVPNLTGKIWEDCPKNSREKAFVSLNAIFSFLAGSGEPLIVNEAASSPELKGLLEIYPWIKRFLAIPVFLEGRPVGIIALANKNKPYLPRDAEYLGWMANVYAVIINNFFFIGNIDCERRLYSDMLENARDVIYVLNRRGLIEYISSGLKEYGYEKEEIMGHHFSEFVFPEDKPLVLKAFRRAMATGKTLPVLKYRLLKKDGSCFDVDQKSAVVRGGPFRIVATIRDVTEEKKIQFELRKSRELLEKIFYSAGDAIFIKGFDGNYKKVNRSFARFFKTQPEKISGKNDVELFGPEMAAGILSSDKQMKKGIPQTMSMEMVINEKKYFFDIVKSILVDERGNPEFILGIIRDSTRSKKLEQEIALIKAKEKIKEITSSLSHDINNTLAVIGGYAAIMSEEASGPKKIKEEFRVIDKSIKKATKIISRFRKRAEKEIK